MVAPRASRFPTTGQGERRLWERDCDVMQSGRRHEHAQYVTSLKIYFRPRPTAVASRILKSLLIKPRTHALHS